MLEVVEEHRVVVEVLNVIPVRDILLQLTNVAMENGVTRPIWQPVKKALTFRYIKHNLLHWKAKNLVGN